VTGTSNLKHFLNTDPLDAGCAHVLEMIDVYVERDLTYGDAAERYPAVAAHLEACSFCLEDHRGLRALLA
jgi:hypothetical protein